MVVFMEFCMKFTEEKSGQYSFFMIEKQEGQSQDSFLHFIYDIRYEVSQLIKAREEYLKYEALHLEDNKWEKYKKSIKEKFEDFIIRYFEWFDSFSYEEILKKYEDFSTDYHNVGKVFLIYLHYFVYNESVVMQLNHEVCIRMENYVLADQVRYSDREYVYTKNIEMAKRQKLRVDGYIVYRIKPFLQKMDFLLNSIKGVSKYEKTFKAITSKEQIRREITEEIKKIREDESLYSAIFEQGQEYVKEKNQEVLAMLFLKYLEMCVYYKGIESQEETMQNFISKLEDYVVYHFDNSFCLTKSQEETYELVKERVAKRIKNYVNKVGGGFFKILSDYDKLVDFKDTQKFKMIEEQENTDEIPKVYSQEEIQQKLGLFLGTVFLLPKALEKEKLPIFLNELKEERDVCLLLSLEYLNRFVYKFAEDYLLDDENIVCLENYIASCEDFKVWDSSLCLAKAKLYARVNARSILKEEHHRKKVLKSSGK